jgi:hypothetical protein
MTANLTDHDVALFLRLRGNTYAEIAHVLGVSRQYVQQTISPPNAVRGAIRARGACEGCGIPLRSGHVHHRATDVPADAYNAEANLALLCKSCHRRAHGDPILREKRRRRTPEELAESHRSRGYRLGATRLGIPVEEYRAHRENGERWCGSCSRWVPEQAFTRNRSNRSGFGGRCAECNRRMVRAYEKSRRDETRVA